jgi:protein gp37
VTQQPQMLDVPLKWKTPKRIFVNSMSDLFHKDVPTDYIKRVFDVKGSTHRVWGLGAELRSWQASSHQRALGVACSCWLS